MIFFQEEKEVNLYAFIGKKISLVQFDPNANNSMKEFDPEIGDTIIRKSYVMDLGFKAEYKVLQSVFNMLGSDTVTFNAYDHYGRPAFADHQYVLLYISKNTSGGYFHQKYQFDPVKRKGGRWVGKNGESIQELLEQKKIIFKNRKVFDLP